MVFMMELALIFIQAGRTPIHNRQSAQSGVCSAFFDLLVDPKVNLTTSGPRVPKQ